jgi:hypothetical protein
VTQMPHRTYPPAAACGHDWSPTFWVILNGKSKIRKNYSSYSIVWKHEKFSREHADMG